MNKVSVSILPFLSQEPVNLQDLDLYLYKVSNADLLHIDVMDGKFVPEKTIGVDEASEIKTELLKNSHLMVEKPEKVAEQYAEFSDIVTFHVEATKVPNKVIEIIKKKGKKVGISLNIETPVSKIKKFIPEVDLIMVMPIHPGKGGQKFDKKALDKIKEVRKLSETVDIAVDGGIDDKTGEKCVKAGANILCSGTYIYKSEDPKITIDILRNL